MVPSRALPAPTPAAAAIRPARRGVIASLALVLALAAPRLSAADAPPADAPPAEAPPNVVLIIGDDISVDDFGCYGHPTIRTPNIDRLAAGGLRFTNAYVTASSCSPSRVSILASRYPHNLGTAAELHGALPAGIPLLPRILRDAGYHCAQAGKIHFGELSGGPGQEAFHVSGAQPGDAGGEAEWLDRLRTRPMDRPFFLWLAAHDAHREWNSGAFGGLNRPEDVVVPPYLADTPETRRDLAHYYDEITRLDHHVGEVMEELRRQKIVDRTLVLVLADNGRPFPRSKTHLYDDSVKTPLVVHWPAGIPRPATVTGLVSTLDLAPTILELAGLPRPETFQGVSFAPLLRDPGATVRDYVFAEKNWHNFRAHMRMVRYRDHVYIRNSWPELVQPGASDTFYNPSAQALKALHAQGRLTPAQANIFQQPRPAEEFYDLRADPHQLHNTIDDRFSRAVVEKLRGVLDRWTEETGDTVPATATEDNIDYVTGARKHDFKRGVPPGAAANALSINRPGPIRDL